MVDWNLRMLRLRADFDKAYCKPVPDTCDEDESRECAEKANPRESCQNKTISPTRPLTSMVDELDLD